MALPNSWDVDSAVISKLQGDTELMTLLPDGVYYGIAKAGKQRYALVSLTDGVDIGVFGGRAIESFLYQVKAVGLSTVFTIAQSKQAAHRIDQVLHDQPL